MTLTVQLKQETINSIYQTEVIQPKIFKDFLHKVWMKEVTTQTEQYKHLEGTFSWSLLRKWTEQDTLERAHLDCITFKDFTKTPNSTMNLTCEERKYCSIAGKYLSGLYVCGSVISMDKGKDVSSVSVGSDDMQRIREVLVNQDMLRKTLAYIWVINHAS